MPAVPQAQVQSQPGTDFPHDDHQRGAGAVPQQSSILAVGACLHDAYMARTVSDAEILDHVEHCTHLMELAYGRYIATRNPADRAEACDWMAQRDEALKCLSPAAKAAREAEIMRAIDDGVGYFSGPHAVALAQTGRAA